MEYIRAERNAQAMREMRWAERGDREEDAVAIKDPWVWVQPKNQDELLERLALARDTAVPERERENLCAAAHTEIVRLGKIEDAYDVRIGEIHALDLRVEELESLVSEFVDDASYGPVAAGTVDTVSCRSCAAVKIGRACPHEAACVVGKAEALLRHLEA